MLGAAFRDSGLNLHDLQALARAADDAGYASIWAPEVGSRDAIVLASLYGAVTKRAAIGTGVIPVYSRSVTALSLAVAAAADASDGRFILGIGAGHRFTAEAWYGATWDRPRTYIRETIEVLRRILSGERVSHDGAVNVQLFHLGSTPPPVPIYLAALTPASLRLAGEVADGVILNWLPPDGIATAAAVAREAADADGRSVRVITYVRCAVVDDPALDHTARVAIREQTHTYLSLPAYANSVRKAGYGKELDAMENGGEHAIDVLAAALCIRGDADTVRAKLRAFIDSGVDEVIVYPVPFGDDPAGSVLHTLRNAI